MVEDDVMDEAAFGPLLDRLPDAVLVVDTLGVLHDANIAASSRFGWSLEEWQGRSLLELVHPDDLDWVISSLGTVQGKDVGSLIEFRARAADGWRLVEANGTAFEHDGEAFVLLAIRDLTERRGWEVAGDDTAMFRTLLQFSSTLTVLTDGAGVVRSASGALMRMTGLDPGAVVGKPLTDVLMPVDRPDLDQAIESLGPDRRHATIEVTLHAEGRTPVPCQLSIVDLTEDPTVGGLVISGHDITELQSAREELEYSAGHDPLTGLANRHQLVTALDARLAAGERRSTLVVAFVDLDRFKPVNDLYGHKVGDEVLSAVATRLRAEVRESDVVARFGGDEFVVVAEATGADPVGAVRDRVLDAFASPFSLSTGEFVIGASVGAVACRDGQDAETVISEADAAMFADKHDRGERRLGPIVTRRELAERLADALDGGEFVVHYQPIVSLADGAWLGLEALARWRHPDRGILLPGDFLDVIEDTGRMGDLGQVVLDRVATDMARLRIDVGATPSISVNAMASEISGTDYPARIAETLRAGGIEPGRLTVELSEREVFGPSTRRGTELATSLAALADAGIHLAVDDFGTGYSSLTHLVTLPIDVIKVDRSFIAGLVHDPQRRSVIAALAGLSDSAGMTMVAEGIDQPGQIEVLRRLGCELGQGFHYARPMPFDEIVMGYRSEVALRDSVGRG